MVDSECLDWCTAPARWDRDKTDPIDQDIMRDKDGPRVGKYFDSDLQESSLFRGVQQELTDRADAEHWKTVPDAKTIPPRPNKIEKPALELHGLAALSDVVASCDLHEMRNNEDPLPKMHDKSIYAELLIQLHEVPQKPDVQSSFQYLGNKSKMHDDDGVWQVQLGRGRRRRQQQQQERMSRDHHEEEDDEKEPEDTHGNAISPPIEATRRVATSKELKRIKKAVAMRRRAGEEDVFTDDELEKVGLKKVGLKPPQNKTKSKEALTGEWPARPAMIHPAPSTRNTRNDRHSPPLASSSSTTSSLDCSSKGGDWDVMYLEPLIGLSPVKSLDSSRDSWEPATSHDSWMTSGGKIVARVSSGSWS